MSTNEKSPGSHGTEAISRRSSSRRPWKWLAILLGLLLLGGGAGGALWLRYKNNNTTAPNPDSSSENDAQRLPPCSDDGDPKTLEPLEFGSPLSVDFDGRWLKALAKRPLPPLEVYPWQPEGLVAVLGEHRMRGDLFALSPDGKTVAAAASGDGYIRLGPSDTLHEKVVLACPGGALALAWSPGGEALAVSGGEGLIRLFDVRTLSRLPPPLVLEKPTAAIASLSYSGDGKYLLGGDRTPKRGTAWVWDINTRKIVHQLKHIGPVLSVAFSPVAGDYRALTAGGVEDGQLHLWDALADKERAIIDFRPSKTDTTVFVGEVAFSPDGKRALSGHSDLRVRIWDVDRLEKDKELHTLAAHAPGNPALAFSPDGQSVVTGRFADGGLWLWNAGDGKQVRRLATCASVSSVRFLPGGERLVFAGSISNDNNLHLHEIESGKELHPPVGHLAALTCVSLSPKGRILASGSYDQSVRLWDLDSGLQRHTIGAAQVWGVGFHPDGKRALFFGGSSGILSFTDVESGQTRTPSYGQQHSGAISSAAITRDGRYAVTGGYHDGTVRMWRLQDGRQVRLFSSPGVNQGPASVTVAPDMRRAIRVGGSRTRLLHLRCQEVKHEWNPGVLAPFLPDGRAVFLGGSNSPVWKITAENVEETERFKLNLTGVAVAALSADGNRVAAVLGSRVAVFEVASGQQRWEWTPPPHFGGVGGVALSPEGGHLLTANGDGTVYVIRLP